MWKFEPAGRLSTAAGDCVPSQEAAVAGDRKQKCVQSQSGAFKEVLRLHFEARSERRAAKQTRPLSMFVVFSSTKTTLFKVGADELTGSDSSARSAAHTPPSKHTHAHVHTRAHIA